MSLVRKPAVAGIFYPHEKDILSNLVKGYLDNAKVSTKTNHSLKAIIAPHAGYRYSGAVAGESFKQLNALDKSKHWKIFLLGPCHRVALRGVSVCAYERLETPMGDIRVSPVAQKLAQNLGFFPVADQQEHSLEVELPFLIAQLPSFEVIPIVVGQVSPHALAQVLEPLLDDQSLLVISTDLSHFFSYEKACQVDAIANQAIPSLDYQRMATEGDACGITGVLTLMEIAQKRGWQGQFLDYKNSGDTSGDKNRVVGYGAYSFSLPQGH